ncbi:uncharacterized protein LOC131303138 [Rhododendron vialii]|uniref:uncharacterized protein LOC131303138 n=1 Tax=Rhododendron vialii TaxID=182163 RepID=UPI00265DCBCC|nr:uncharacterized protein LOC131303138 [Rhododendron vialii]
MAFTVISYFWLIYGEQMTVLAGCSLFSLAFKHVAAITVGVVADRIVRAIAELSSASGWKGSWGGGVCKWWTSCWFDELYALIGADWQAYSLFAQGGKNIRSVLGSFSQQVVSKLLVWECARLNLV